MPEFGIYFGSEIINITEVKGKKVLVNLSIPQAKIISSALEQKILDETKIATALKEEFTRSDISPNNVSVALAGEDFIIRTFDLPIFLSKKELEYSAIAFEAKKYIPFKIEDLVFDFRLYPDRKNKKILVLFVGIKREILNKYLSIFKQLHIRLRLIEYSGFSILRLLRLSGLKDNGIFALINVDLAEETNFLVCQNGFPLFSRDIILIPKSETKLSKEEIASGKPIELSSTAKLIFMEKLKSEIRISLDFFQRKFPTKPLDRGIILSLPQFQTEIAALTKDLGLSAIPLETSRFLNKNLEFSSALVRSYATAISNVQKLPFPVNLLRPPVKKEAELPTKALPIAISVIRINPRAVSLALLIIFLTVGWGWYRRLPLEKALKAIQMDQPQIEGISGEQSFAELTNLEGEYTNKKNIMEDVIKNRFYLTKAMDIIPRLMPKGAWLNSFSFRSSEKGFEFNLGGMVFQADPDKEFSAVNDIVLGLKNDPEVNRYFKEINVVSMERVVLERLELEVTKFAIVCR